MEPTRCRGLEAMGTSRSDVVSEPCQDSNFDEERELRHTRNREAAQEEQAEVSPIPAAVPDPNTSSAAPSAVETPSGGRTARSARSQARPRTTARRAKSFGRILPEQDDAILEIALDPQPVPAADVGVVDGCEKLPNTSVSFVSGLSIRGASA